MGGFHTCYYKCKDFVSGVIKTTTSIRGRHAKGSVTMNRVPWGAVDSTRISPSVALAAIVPEAVVIWPNRPASPSGVMAIPMAEDI